MFGFLKKKVDKERAGVIDEFNSIIDQTKTGKEEEQMVIGHGINMANSIFMKSFLSPSDFRNRPHKEKLEYFKKFNKFKDGVREKDFGIYIGVHLFGTWLLALIENDSDLEKIVNKELAWLSKKGEPFGGMV